jgi:hypothetical protein
MASFSLFVDVTPSKFAKITQERRNVRLSLLFRTFCHVVYATLGYTLPHLDPLHLIALLNGIDHILPLYYLSEHGVVPI